MLCHILVLVIAFVPRLLAITNGDATPSAGRRSVADSAVLTPEELLHGMVPCTCIDIRLCPSLLNSLKHPISASSIELKHLQRFTCGFKGFTPFVCCNEMASTPMVDPNSKSSASEALTPSGGSSENPDQHTGLKSAGEDVNNPTRDFFSSTFNPLEEHGEAHPITSVANPYSDTYEDTSPTNTLSKSTSKRDSINGFAATESVTSIFGSDTPSYNSISSTNTPHYDPTDDTSATFGDGFTQTTSPDPSDDNINIPKGDALPKDVIENRERDVYDATFNVTLSFDTNATVPFTPEPPRNPDDAVDEEKYKENPYESYETTTNIPMYLPTDDDVSTFTSSPPSVYVTSTSNDHTYDPSKDIADVFWNSSHVPNEETSTPKIHLSSYDPTYDIRDIFGASPGKEVQQPEHKPNTSNESNFPLVTKESLDKVQTSTSTTFQVTVTSGLDTARVTPLPDITLSYNLLVKNTNIEKKYLDFFNMFYKNHLNKPAIAQRMPIRTPSRFGGQVNSTILQTPPLKSIQLNTFVSSSKDSRDGKQIPSDNNYNEQTVQKPRTTSTHRYVRQYNPDFYFDNRFAPHYFSRHLSSSPTYYPRPSYRPQYTNNHRTTIYQNLHKAQTQPPDSWLYNDYNFSASDSESVSTSASGTDPVPAYQQYNSYPHHMRNRGTEFNRNIGRPRPRNRKPGSNNDGSITFPKDEDERKPFGHYSPNLDSSYYPGPFFEDNSHRRPNNNPRQPSRKPSPFHPQQHWGYNHPNEYPNFNENNPDPIDPVNNQPLTGPPKQPNPTPMLANSVSTDAPPAPTPATATVPAPEVTTTPPPAMAPTDVTPVTLPPAGGAAGLEAKRQQLLPNDGCGVSIEERIVGGKTATLGAYPWIARIGYLRPGSTRVLYRCAGTLINNFYVITAAHCVTNLPGGLVLSTIRLGELDDTTDPDCMNEECADPVQNYSPMQIMVHQAYDKPQFKNDVGLVRLDRPVNITTYVSPICLPFDSLRSKNYTGLKAVVAGWGASNIGASSATPVLQWVSLTVAPMAQCVTTFATRTGVQVGPGQLCAGGEQGRDSCEGDSGGPLMRPEQPDADSLPRYFLIGIVSFGAKRCGSDNMPGVYTDVSSYLDWILNSIQP